MGKRIIREHILLTRSLTQLPWPEAAKLFLAGKKLHAYLFVMLPYPDREVWNGKTPKVTDEEHAEVIALLAAPLSHKRHVERIGAVMEKVAERWIMNLYAQQYTKETDAEADVRRARAAKAERHRLRKLPRQGA